MRFMPWGSDRHTTLSFGFVDLEASARSQLGFVARELLGKTRARETPKVDTGVRYDPVTQTISSASYVGPDRRQAPPPAIARYLERKWDFYFMLMLAALWVGDMGWTMNVQAAAQAAGSAPNPFPVVILVFKGVFSLFLSVLTLILKNSFALPWALRLSVILYLASFAW
jgi:hypothetical protein